MDVLDEMERQRGAQPGCPARASGPRTWTAGDRRRLQQHSLEAVEEWLKATSPIVPTTVRSYVTSLAPVVDVPGVARPNRVLAGSQGSGGDGFLSWLRHGRTSVGGCIDAWEGQFAVVTPSCEPAVDLADGLGDGSARPGIGERRA